MKQCIEGKKNEAFNIDNNEINKLYINIKDLVEESKNRIYKTVNMEMINLYWNIGRIIVEKQEGRVRAQYGDYLIEGLSSKLTEKFGKGFSTKNLKRMRKFYLCFTKGTTMLSQLTWSHYLELLKIDEPIKRNFYMKVKI